MVEPNSGQFFATFSLRITFPPISNNLFLTSIWYFTRKTFNIHISTQILFGIIHLFLATE